MADLSVCGQRHGQHRVAVVHVRKVDARAVAGRAREALHIQVVGEHVAGISDLGNAVGRAHRRTQQQSRSQQQADEPQPGGQPVPHRRPSRRRQNLSFRRRGVGIEGLHRRDKPESALGQRLHKPRVLRRVAQRLAKLVHRYSQAVVEVDGRVGAPKLNLQGLPRNHFPRMLEQHGQQLEGLALQAYPHTGAAQFSRFQVGFKNSELHPVGDVVLWPHTHGCTDQTPH